MTKILISAMNGIIGYELLKSLKKKYYVIGIDFQKNGISNKIANEFLVCPNGKSKEFIKFVEKISTKVDLMFFYVDEEILNISKNIKSKKILSKIVISPYDSLISCMNKSKFYNILKVNKIITPKFKNAAPAFIKPIYGRGSKNCFFSSNKLIVNAYLKSKDYIVQEQIIGKEYTVDCYFDKSYKLIYSLPRERIVKSNISFTNKVSNINIFKNIILKVSKIFNFCGPINFQFIIQQKTKIPYLIEINPRLSGGVIFSIISGFNPISMSVNDFLNNNVVLPKNIKYGKYTRYLISKKI